MEAPGPALRPHPDGVLLAVWVVPGAAREEIVGWHDGALRVRVGAPAEAGKANRAAAALLARAFGARRAAVVAGHTARRKQVLLYGVTREAAERSLAALLDGR